MTTETPTEDEQEHEAPEIAPSSSSTHQVDDQIRRRNLITAIVCIIFFSILIAIAVNASNVLQ